jgi:hypothetical protein
MACCFETSERRNPHVLYELAQLSIALVKEPLESQRGSPGASEAVYPVATFISSPGAWEPT